MRKDELRGMTRTELLEKARELEIKGRSGLSKDELIDAIAAAAPPRARATGGASRTARRGDDADKPHAVDEAGAPPAARGSRSASSRSAEGSPRATRGASPRAAAPETKDQSPPARPPARDRAGDSPPVRPAARDRAEET